jgi:hypothetical protein
MIYIGIILLKNPLIDRCYFRYLCEIKNRVPEIMRSEAVKTICHAILTP